MILNALERAEARLLELPTLEAYFARRESGSERVEDRSMLEVASAELLSHQSANGSWGDDLALTAEALITLAELPRTTQVSEHVERALSWLRERRRQPGTFVDGCSASRHELGLCEHFAGGFFSPGPPDRDLAGARLTNGLTFPTDADARLGLSAFALQASLRWDAKSIDNSLQLDALQRLVEIALEENDAHIEIAVPTLTIVLTALTMAPNQEQIGPPLQNALTRLAGIQRADGTWPEAEPFHVADVFRNAVNAGYTAPAFEAAIARTAELLVLTQTPENNWGPDAESYRLLSGWRALRHAARANT